MATDTMSALEVPASVGQRLLWMMRHYRGDLGALSCPVVCRLQGPLDDLRLQEALDRVVHRHEALRTTFTGRGPRLVQVVHAARSSRLRREDVSGDADPEAAVDRAVAEELRAPVDVAESALRATLWRLGPADHLLCLNTHHLVTDAWSSGILFRDVCLAYSGADLPPVPAQYRDFVARQQDLLAGDGLRRHHEYWRRQLGGASLPRLPALAEKATGTGTVQADLEPATVAALLRLIRRERATMFAVLLAAFFGQLRTLTGQKDLTVASMFANRSRPETREIVGFLANMVLLRARLSESMTFADLVRQVHATAVGALAHQELPYQMLPLRSVEIGEARADDLVFQVMPDTEYCTTVAGLRLEMLVPEGIGNRFRVEFTLTPVGRSYRAVLFYTKDRIDTDGARRLIAGFGALAAAASAAPDVPLRELCG